MTEPLTSSERPVFARLVRSLRFFTVFLFAACGLFYIVLSWRWRLMVDASIMHYVVFLLRHGLRPYAEISDNNMPGAYFVEAAGMSLFGLSDLGWRLFEFCVLGSLAASLILLARRWDAMAGVFAGGMFVVLHSAEGPQYAAERELTLTLLLVLAYLALFRAVESRRYALMLPFGVLAGLASSIKPTFLPLPLALLLVAAFVLHRRHERPTALLAYSLLGMLAMLCCDLGFLWHEHALGAFWFILSSVLPAYVGIGQRPPLILLLFGSLPKLGYPLLLLWLPLLVANWRRYGPWDWQRWVLLLGAFFGLLSFALQRKGFLHHRYTFLVFFYLLVGLDIFLALAGRGWARMVAAAALLFALFVAVPRTLRVTRAIVGYSHLELALESDLTQLAPPPDLQGKVQCFDLVFGCLDALYHQRLLENSGFTGDLLFFPYRDSPATEYYRERFWEGARRRPAEVIVVSNQNLGRDNGFDKLQRWPAFDTWLEANYAPVVERHFTFEHFGSLYAKPVAPAEQDAYRIYIRNGSPLQRSARGLWQQKAGGQS